MWVKGKGILTREEKNLLKGRKLKKGQTRHKKNPQAGTGRFPIPENQRKEQNAKKRRLPFVRTLVLGSNPGKLTGP